MLAFAFFAGSARAESMLQYFNTSYAEMTAKMPELAEAGYKSLWLPPPTKGSGGLSVGYDMWDPFDLGSIDQRGSVRTRYGTEAELLRLVETAHRFGIRVYFDNIMNHRAFDVPGFNEFTPIDIYPGVVPEDFHLRTTQEGFFRKWDNTRNWNDSWQVQNLGLADLIDFAQEPGSTNLNFGPSEGSTGLKINFVRDRLRPHQYCFLPNGQYVGFGPDNGITTALIDANEGFYTESIEQYLNRAARWLMDRTKADGLRLDAVKHVRADFFGATFGPDKDTSDYGYNGQVQRQFNITRGFSDANHRDSVFNTEQGRDDAMLFGEHLGEPPGYGPYIDSGMRLVDNPLRQEFNDRLGSPFNGLNGFDRPGWGGFAPSASVMHAQSHDNDFAARRELQHAMYFTREGIGLLYTDGNYQAETLGESGGAFPRHSNTSFLGQWNDPRVPNLLYIHDQFVRGYQRGVWSDGDLVAYERIDKRLDGGVSDADGVTMIIVLNDNYANGQRPFDRFGFKSAFPPGAYLWQYARGPASGGDSMNGFFVTMQDAGEGRSYFPSNVTVPRGGYFVFSWKNPDPSDLWAPAGGRPVTILQNGAEVGTVDVPRRDGPNGDAAFNGSTLPETARPILPTDTNTTDFRYFARVPRVTDGSQVKFVARADGSAENILIRLDEGINLNTTNHSGGDPRDNPPAVSFDMFLGYEQPNFVSRIHPELFAATNTGVNNTTGSAGAETYTTTGAAALGSGNRTIDGDTAAFIYHEPTVVVGGIPTPPQQYDASEHRLWAKTNGVGSGYKMFVYFTGDGVANPEGAAGRGQGGTQVVEMLYQHNEGGDNWWRSEPLGVDFIAGTSKYKIGIYKEGASSIFPSNGGAVARKSKMMTTFETIDLDLTSVSRRPHIDYGVTKTGLDEGMHQVRARAFLKRSGIGEPTRSPIYNTFMQTFYYDAERPTGEVRFPQTNGDTVGGSEYGMVFRTDASVTEVWVNIDDGDPTNDDSQTRTLQGNGAGFEPFTDANRNGTRDSGEPYEDLNENGVWDDTLATSWVKLSEITPSLAFQPGDPKFVKEWRLNYVNIPSTGSATIRARLRELSSADYKDFHLSDEVGHYTTLERTVTTAGPDIRMFVAFPSQNGEAVGDDYVVKTYFSKSLADGLNTQQLIDRFLVQVGGTEASAETISLSRSGYTINYDETANFHALAFTLPGLYNDQPDYLHRITVTHDRPQPLNDLTATRLVRALPSTRPRVSIITPPELGSDGRPFQILLPDVPAPTAQQREYLVRVTTGSDATDVALTFDVGTGSFSTPQVTTAGSSKFWDFTWQNMNEGVFRFTATVTAPGGTNTDSRNATVLFRQLATASASDPDDDDDGLLDGDESTPTPLPNGYPTDSPKYKPNPEQWNNGEVHIAFAYGRSNPLSPDSDSDGLPDGLEVGWRGIVVAGEDFSDTGYTTSTTVGAGNTVFDWADANTNGIHDTGETSEPFTDVNSNDAFDIGEVFTDTGYTATSTIGAGNGVFDWADTNSNGAHDAGEASEPFTDTDTDNAFDFGTIATRDTDGDGFPNFIGDIDPPFFNTLDNLGSVPGVNSASEGGDRARQLRGSMTDPGNPDSDGDGILDGIEDANRNGWLDGDGESIPATFNPWLGRNWPNSIRDPGENWTETDPNNSDTDGDGASDGFGEDIDFNGLIAGDTNNNRVCDPGEMWSETDPLNADTDGDGLPDGWEVQHGLDPLDDGVNSCRTGGPGLVVNGPNGDPDSDGFTNIQELTNGTSPRKDDTAPPPPADSIVIGPRPPVTVGGIVNDRVFTDWKIDDLIALDEYNGDGNNNQGSDLYRAYDGFDSSRDLVAFYARDGGSGGSGGDDTFYFRVDMHDLQAFAEEGNLDLYVVMDFGNTAVGEYALPDEVDTGTEMRWEAVVALYSSDNGAVYVDTHPGSNSTAIGQPLSGFGVQRRDRFAANGFRQAHYDAQLDAIEFSISRQALLDAGWNGNAQTINYQVFTTRDGTQNSPQGLGDIGGRSDIRDTIYDDDVASDYWRDQSRLAGSGSVLKSWFGPSAGNDTFKRAKVISLMHEARPVIPASEVHALINSGAGTGFYRPLDVHQAYSAPMALHIPATLASSIQWASVDPAVIKPWRDGPAFNARLAALRSTGVVDLVGATFSSHIIPLFPQTFTADNVTEANNLFAGVYGSAASTQVLYPPERVLDSFGLQAIRDSGFTFTLADQMRHMVKWFGRTSALGNDGYRINRVEGLNLLVIHDQASNFRFDNHDGGLNMPLRELLSRKARSGAQDQVVVLHSDWSDFLDQGRADNYDRNIRWIASRPWLQLVTPDAIAAGEVDSNRDGTGDVWPVVERGAPGNLPRVAKDFIDHATQEDYIHWYDGQAGREEGLSPKIFEVRPGVNLPQAFGRIGFGGTSELAWNAAQTVGGGWGGLRGLARGAVHGSMYLTAFHNQQNNNLSKFSTGDYIYPDGDFNSLSGFAAAAQSQARWGAVFAAVGNWAQQASAGAYLGSVQSAASDVDLDGENEHLLFNDRVFVLFEAQGGRMTGAWVRDLVSGAVYQTVGNPLSYPGLSTEEEGTANVINGQVGSYRTSGLKDWFAGGANTSQYVNDLFNAAPAASGTGWTFTSSDGRVSKTVTLAAHKNGVSVSYDLDPAITTLFVRSGLNPHLDNLLKRGQETLAPLQSGASAVSLLNDAPDAGVRAVMRLQSGVTHNASAIDDNPGGGQAFDALNMRNQAQTEQVELEVSDGAMFSFDFETGLTLSNDTDNDGLPDRYETDNQLNPNSSIGDDGADGNGDGDALTNYQEFIVGRNPGAADVYAASVVPETNGAHTIRFDTIPNRVYRVWWSESLTAPSWQPASSDILGTGATLSWTDDGTSTGTHPNTRTRRFYRVEVRILNP